MCDLLGSHLEEIVQALSRRLAEKPPFGPTIALDFGEAGYVRVDTSTAPYQITSSREKTDVTIATTPAYFEGVLAGDLTIHSLIFTGRAKIKDNAMMALVFNMIISS